MRTILLLVGLGIVAVLVLGWLLQRVGVKSGSWLVMSGNLAARLGAAYVFGWIAGMTLTKGGAWIAVAFCAAVLALFDLALIALTIFGLVRYGIVDDAPGSTQ